MSKKTAAPQTKASLLTMADLAARFSLPESTARYYCRRFNAFLPQEGKGRRKYTAEAIPVFAAVQEAMRRTRHARSVEMELSLQFPANAPAVKEAAQGVLVPSAPDYNPAPVLQEFSRGILQVLSAQAQALERIADVLSGIERIVPENDAAKPPAPKAAGAENPQTGKDIEELRKEIKILRGLMDSSEQIHQQDVEQLRKWLNRLGSTQEGQSGSGE